MVRMVAIGLVSMEGVLLDPCRPPQALCMSVVVAVLALGKYGERLHMTSRRGHCNSRKNSVSFFRTQRKVAVSVTDELTNDLALVPRWVLYARLDLMFSRVLLFPRRVLVGASACNSRYERFPSHLPT